MIRWGDRCARCDRPSSRSVCRACEFQIAARAADPQGRQLAGRGRLTFRLGVSLAKFAGAVGLSVAPRATAPALASGAASLDAPLLLSPSGVAPVSSTRPVTTGPRAAP